MRVLICDDDKIITSSISIIIKSYGYEVVGVAECASEAITLYDKYLPDILLLDIRMNGEDGLYASSEILKKHDKANILLITTFKDDEYIIKALKIGVKGYLLKQNLDNLKLSIETIMNGNTVFDNTIINKLSTLVSEGNLKLESFNLSTREIEVIEAIKDGLSNREIASKLFLSEGTVRNYISVILEKLELKDRTQIAVFYYKSKGW